MNTTRITKLTKHLWRTYGTMNNVVISVALLIAAGWAWGSVTTMQRNYELQRDFDARQRDLELTALEVETLKYQQNYYKSDEYKDLAARTSLGLASPGEKVLILPPNSDDAKRETTTSSKERSVVGSANSNLEQWYNFLIGNTAGRLQG